MKQLAFFLTLLLPPLLLCLFAESQRLPGCAIAEDAAPPLMRGHSDEDRWRKFCKIQPHLIGMKFSEITNIFGEPKYCSEVQENQPVHYKLSEPDITYGGAKLYGEPHNYGSIQYNLSEPNSGLRKQGSLAAIELTMIFKEGVVSSYEVKAIFWS
ncbi:MAG TPA: hypothetical protein V6C76_13790 [Drouetiella sp.]